MQLNSNSLNKIKPIADLLPMDLQWKEAVLLALMVAVGTVFLALPSRQAHQDSAPLDSSASSAQEATLEASTSER